MKHLTLIASLITSLLLTACGGGDGGSSAPPAPPPPPPPVVNASPGGIWVGTTSGSQTILGIATESGEFHFLSADLSTNFLLHIVGTASVSGTAATASILAIPEFGMIFADGSITAAAGTITATIAERSTLNGSSTFTTTQGGVSNDTFSLVYSPLYDRDSSLATAAGNYRDLNGTVVSVDGNGNIFSQDTVTGCVANGAVSIIDSRFNAYHIEYTFASCTGAQAVFNGVTFTGLAILDNTVTPEQAVIGVTSTGDPKIAGTQILERL